MYRDLWNKDVVVTYAHGVKGSSRKAIAEGILVTSDKYCLELCDHDGETFVIGKSSIIHIKPTGKLPKDYGLVLDDSGLTYCVDWYLRSQL